MRDGHLADLLLGRQERLQRHRIGDLAHSDQFTRDLEDLAVQRLVEMLRLQEVRDPVKGIVVDEDRAEQRLFRLDIVRGFAIERGLDGCEFTGGFGHSMSICRMRRTGRET